MQISAAIGSRITDHGLCILHRLVLALSASAAALALAGGEVRAQSPWRPDKAVEIIASAAPGGSNDQIAFWEEALARMSATEEWKRVLETQLSVPHFLRSRETARYLEAGYSDTRTIMTELGLAK